VEHSDVCKILDDYVRYPVQAWECSLADIAPASPSGQWSQEALHWFRSTAELQLCQFRVTGFSELDCGLVPFITGWQMHTNIAEQSSKQLINEIWGFV
jgi:hypothetical protein